ncbi:MAG: hypothetical protein IPM54_22800 [Polyangiaceae bacterium]|nr:hypothetical protein [Polyangiaceae bacterium]
MENKDIDTSASQPPQTSWHGQQRAMRIVTAGSIVEALGGIGAVVLCVLGLAGIARETMIAISIIAIGAALLFAGGAMASRYNQLASRVSGGRADETEFGGSVGAEFLTGAAGVVLGVLILLNIYPLILGPIAVIAFGGGLLLSTGATAGINSLVEAYPFDRRVRIAREAVQGAAAVQSLVGIGAAILGILALLGIEPYTLMLVALLAVGGAILISASAVSSRALASMRGTHVSR